MTPRQRQHLDRLMGTFKNLASTKYERGTVEHGGDLEDKPVLEMAIEEALDLPIYLLTLSDQHAAARNKLSSSIQDRDWGGVLAAYNILTFGNPIGEVRPDRAGVEL